MNKKWKELFTFEQTQFYRKKSVIESEIFVISFWRFFCNACKTEWIIMLSYQLQWLKVKKSLKNF